MQYYAKSAGSEANQDYSWYQITDNCLQRYQAPVQVLAKHNTLIHPTESCLLLLRIEGIAYLLIDNLPSQRKDIQRRTIRNTLLLQATHAQEEVFFRSVILAYLEQQDKVVECVNHLFRSSSNTPGWKVLYKDIKQLEHITTLTIFSSYQPDISAQYAADNTINRNRLIHEVQHYQLPKRNGSLLVCTIGKDIEKLKQQGNLWRVLVKETETLKKFHIHYPKQWEPLFKNFYSFLPWYFQEKITLPYYHFIHTMHTLFRYWQLSYLQGWIVSAYLVVCLFGYIALLKYVH